MIWEVIDATNDPHSQTLPPSKLSLRNPYKYFDVERVSPSTRCLSEAHECFIVFPQKSGHVGKKF